MTGNQCGSLLFSVLAPIVVWAQTTPANALLVLSKGDKTLAIVDAATLQVVAKVPSGPDPHEVAASADGRFAYISNYGFGAYNTITPVDLAVPQSLPAIDLGPLRGPHGLDFAGGKLYFTAEAAKVIGRYDPAVGKVDWVLGTGQNRTHMVLVSADLSRIVTSNVSSGTMTVIEKTVGRAPGGPPPGAAGPPPGAPDRPPLPPSSSQGDWNESVIAVGRGAEGFDVSPDGREIWCANAQDGTISIIEAAAKRVVRTLDANVRGANRLKFTPDGRRVLVSTLGGPDLVVLDAVTRAELKRVRLGHGAAGIQMDPDGSRVFVACTPDGYVAVIDLKTLVVTGHIDAGPQPDGLAFAVRN
jgi:YVTN family beta-propeller protein